MQIIVRVLTSGPANVSFPELDWILDSGRNTVIFCKTIGFGFRVAAYLWRTGITKGIEDLPSKLRLFNCLNSNKFNQETLGFLNTDSSTPRIIVSIDFLGVGWDSPNTENVVVLGDPDTLDSHLLQKWGCAGRDHLKVPDPRAFLYHTRTAISTAQTVMNSQDVQKAAATPMDLSMAELHAALCKSSAINVLYDNPAIDVPCVCENCEDKIVPTRGSCSCSGCMPEAPIPARKKPSKPRAKRNQAISKAMLELALRRLTPIQRKIFDANPLKNVWLPPDYYLPDEGIHALAKSIYSTETEQDIRRLIPSQPFLESYYSDILNCCIELRPLFDEMREQVPQGSQQKSRKSQPLSDAVEKEEENEQEVGFRDVCQSSGLKLKINFATRKIVTTD